jgi:hypothetical protein
LTASSATVEIGGAFLPCRAFAAMSASSKKLRRAWLQHNASIIPAGDLSRRLDRLLFPTKAEPQSQAETARNNQGDPRQSVRLRHQPRPRSHQQRLGTGATPLRGLSKDHKRLSQRMGRKGFAAATCSIFLLESIFI